MNKPRVLKALLFIANEAGGLGPTEVNSWLAELQQAKLLEINQRKVGDCLLPFLEITEKGKEKL